MKKLLNKSYRLIFLAKMLVFAVTWIGCYDFDFVEIEIVESKHYTLQPPTEFNLVKKDDEGMIFSSENNQLRIILYPIIPIEGQQTLDAYYNSYVNSWNLSKYNLRMNMSYSDLKNGRE